MTTIKKLLLIIVLAFVIFAPQRIFAGGGRFSNETIGDNSAAVGGGIEVRSRISKHDDSSTLSIGEHAEFRIQNPRPGDKCDTTDGFTDVNGYLHGNCTATTVGEYLIYVHSNDHGDDGSKTVLYFYAPPTPTITPTPIPQITSQPQLTPVTNTTTITPTKSATNTAQLTNPNSIEPTPEVIPVKIKDSSPNIFIITSAILSALLLIVAVVLLLHFRTKRLRAKNAELSPLNEDVTSFSPLLK